MSLLTGHCFCHCKDTNSKAIHNIPEVNKNSFIIVFATAKILIRKQFTTTDTWNYTCDDCFCHCKDTNSKAIHNYSADEHGYIMIVFATAKILIRKQFTTDKITYEAGRALFLPLQRY